MAIDGNGYKGGKLEEQSLRYYWTVSDEGKEKKERKEGNCG